MKSETLSISERNKCYGFFQRDCAARQHVIISNRDGQKKLCWRPHKTLRITGKMLKVTIIPSLQAALDAMPKSKDALTFLTNNYGRPFASAAAFGNKFADWCRGGRPPAAALRGW